MKRSLIICGFLLSLLSFGYGQDFVYRPKNPAFGGDTFNYQWLLSAAQAQDTQENPAITDRNNPLGDRNTLDRFTESLNRQLLSRLSRELLTNQFGEDGLEEGTFQVGDFQFDVSQDLDGMLIRIFDGQGGETQITIPFP